ncbi:hypothetical protein NX059_010029 [Plenodomus lindquistii]|nr:hypothetical protein NX059_010029 [Plenodomus lindquistii]
MGTAVADDGTVNITIARYNPEPSSLQSESGSSFDSLLQDPCDNCYVNEEADEIDDQGEANIDNDRLPGNHSEPPLSSRRNSIWGLDNALPEDFIEQDHILDTFETASYGFPQSILSDTSSLADDFQHWFQHWDQPSPDIVSDAGRSLVHDHAFSISDSIDSPSLNSSILSWDDGDYSRRQEVYGRATTLSYRNSADMTSELSENTSSLFADLEIPSSGEGGWAGLLEALNHVDALRSILRRVIVDLDDEASEESPGSPILAATSGYPLFPSALPAPERP